MATIRVHTTYIEDAVNDHAKTLYPEVEKAHKTTVDKTGLGHEFLGWVDLPGRMDETLSAIETTAKRLRSIADVLVVIGIGGSYLGAKAVLETLDGYFTTPDGMDVVFVGHHLSAAYMEELQATLADKSFAINVISKSGTTTEPAIAFRFFRRLLESKLGKAEAAERIVATTDATKGALRTLAEREGYDTFVIDDDIGGRYSVFTPVGLLPVACRGHDVNALLAGAKAMMTSLHHAGDTDALYRYVAARQALYQTGKKVELLVYYEPKLAYVAEWWKQLFGESEGKDGKGLFVAGAAFTTDLHSLGQYLQAGERHLFETVVSINKPLSTLTIQTDEADLDGLNYLAGKSIHDVNRHAMDGTLLAHAEGGTPSIVLELERLDAHHVGALLYFFMSACALSGYVLGVNPFDQPGVEAYKVNMFALLDKPGFEARAKTLRERLGSNEED